MPAQLAAEDALRIGQRLFHEDVPDPLALGHAAGLLDRLAQGVAAPQVVDDAAARVALLGQEVLGQHGREDVAADRVAALVDEDAAVGVAVEAHARLDLQRAALLALGLPHGVLELGQVRLDEGVWLVDERHADLEVHLLDDEVFDVAEDLGHHHAGHAVAGVADHAHRPLEVEELQDVLPVGGPDVDLLEAALLAGGGPLAELLGDPLDVLQAGGRADRLGERAADLEAVVLDGVVAGGGLDAADAAVVVDGEVDAARVDHAHVQDVGPGAADAVDQRPGQLGRVRPHVPADDDRVLALDLVGGVLSATLQEGGGRVADLPGVVGTERVGVDGADVVCLEDFADHGWPPSITRRPARARTPEVRGPAAPHVEGVRSRPGRRPLQL